VRRRMLNPDFFTDPDIVSKLDAFGRLFYQGLWCVADDSGCFELNPLFLKMKIFPGDNISLDQIQGYLDVLIDSQKIITYLVAGKNYGWLKNFSKHQRLEKPSPPSVPLPEWILWHGEEEQGNQRHKWFYEILEGRVPDVSRTCPGRVQDNSGTSPGRVGDVSPLEEKGSEEKRREGEEKHIKSDLRNPTPPTTPPSDASLVLEHWNSKGIIRHRRLTDKFRRSVNAALKIYTLGEVKNAIDNYERVLSGPEFYWTHKWTLKEFLDRGLEKFLDWDVCATNYLRERDSPKKADMPTNVRNALRLVEQTSREQGDEIINIWEVGGT